MFNDFTLIINFVLYFQNEAAYTAVWRWDVWGGGGGGGRGRVRGWERTMEVDFFWKQYLEENKTWDTSEYMLFM